MFLKRNLINAFSYKVPLILLAAVIYLVIKISWITISIKQNFYHENALFKSRINHVFLSHKRLLQDISKQFSFLSKELGVKKVSPVLKIAHVLTYSDKDFSNTELGWIDYTQPNIFVTPMGKSFHRKNLHLMCSSNLEKDNSIKFELDPITETKKLIVSHYYNEEKYSVEGCFAAISNSDQIYDNITKDLNLKLHNFSLHDLQNQHLLGQLNNLKPSKLVLSTNVDSFIVNSKLNGLAVIFLMAKNLAIDFFVIICVFILTRLYILEKRKNRKLSKDYNKKQIEESKNKDKIDALKKVIAETNNFIGDFIKHLFIKDENTSINIGDSNKSGIDKNEVLYSLSDYQSKKVYLSEIVRQVIDYLSYDIKIRRLKASYTNKADIEILANNIFALKKIIASILYNMIDSSAEDSNISIESNKDEDLNVTKLIFFQEEAFAFFDSEPLSKEELGKFSFDKIVKSNLSQISIYAEERGMKVSKFMSDNKEKSITISIKHDKKINEPTGKNNNVYTFK